MVSPMEGQTPGILPHHSSVDGHLGMRYRHALLILDESWGVALMRYVVHISRRGRLHRLLLHGFIEQRHKV